MERLWDQTRQVFGDVVYSIFDPFGKIGAARAIRADPQVYLPPAEVEMGRRSLFRIWWHTTMSIADYDDSHLETILDAGYLVPLATAVLLRGAVRDLRARNYKRGTALLLGSALGLGSMLYAASPESIFAKRTLETMRTIRYYKMLQAGYSPDQIGWSPATSG